jgi:hypothetical protein
MGVRRPPQFGRVIPKSDARAQTEAKEPLVCKGSRNKRQCHRVEPREVMRSLTANVTTPSYPHEKHLRSGFVWLRRAPFIRRP